MAQSLCSADFTPSCMLLPGLALVWLAVEEALAAKVSAAFVSAAAQRSQASDAREQAAVRRVMFALHRIHTSNDPK